jgi:hydrogenase maturation protease
VSGKEWSLFVGIGSPHGDDRVGWEIVERLTRSAKLSREFGFRRARVPTDLLDWLDGVARLHLCDACQTSNPPGTLHCWKWEGSTLIGSQRPPVFCRRLRSAGSHAWGLFDVLSLAERLKRLPEQVTIWGVEGLQFDAGHPLSPEMADRLPEVVATIEASLSYARNVVCAVALEPGRTAARSERRDRG